MAITYSIDGGADAAKFNINSTSGALTFKVAPDFEKPGDANADNIYEVSVKAADAGGLSSSKLVKVTVTDVSEGSPPQITSAGAISIKENSTTVMTVTATDPDDGTPPIEPPIEPPVTGGRPGPSNTGYKNAPGYPGSVTPFTGGLTDGQTISFKSFNNGIDLGTKDAPRNNLTFIGCLFKAAGQCHVRLYGGGHKFSYCSFEPAPAAPPVTQQEGYQFALCANGGWYTNVKKLTVENCDIWGFANAIMLTGSSSTQAAPHVIRNNWIHDARGDGGGSDHTDGIGCPGGTGTVSAYVVIDNNVVETLGNTEALAFQGGTYDHMTVTNNLFGGWGYAIHIATSSPNCKFENNVFSTRLNCNWGPIYPHNFWTQPGSTWKNNKWMVPTGAAWGKREHDGWFWMPVEGARAGTDDTKYVSQTDYGS